jgi:hypothetical protein
MGYHIDSRRRPGHGLALAFALLALLPLRAHGQSDSSAKPDRRLFHELPYGSDRQFNPATVIVNEGYDMLRIITQDRLVGEIPYGESSTTLWHSVTHADEVVRHYGWNRWVRDELLPLSLHGKGAAAWAPNYQLHLLGAGMTYARMADWYQVRDVPHPRIASAMTLYAGHFMNEIVENAGNPTGEDEEGLTDLLIFDPAGMLLWSTDRMRRAFSGSWEINNWYGQPTWIPRTRRLENAFSAYYVRAPLPHTDNWKFFALNGNAFLLGVSRRVTDSLMVSVGGGAISIDVPVVSETNGSTTVALAQNFGVFLDRNGSLLVSFLNRAGRTNGPTLNVYPGVLKFGPLTAGLWAQAVRGGIDGHGIRWGITSALGGGLGSVSR